MRDILIVKSGNEFKTELVNGQPVSRNKLLNLLFCLRRLGMNVTGVEILKENGFMVEEINNYFRPHHYALYCQKKEIRHNKELYKTDGK